MALEVFPGRFTAQPEGGVTVFLIGMRANRWWKLGSVMRVAAAMPRMLRYLAANPESGMLGFHQWLGRTTILVSYWRSPEDLMRFAADRDAPHLAPWRDFMKTVSGTGDIGVWHETYSVPASGMEAVYNGMPAFGLAKATAHVPVKGGLNTARQRWAHASADGRE
ncbi:DUF4188 domain-containing protein [Sinomonas sp. ASV322]|uniref:DUF4188 domain-containing protein n=1 Tax=Sinomonas sp. ASV322 TaxID=3041920 RepID=UPI0027DB6E24|nr:DUF4188 domain-containing protein [Sinomonas sp. ASV322]MDQ4502949.1 DUF4188 domain-containing protein [Sinomonas sp. ASV322]